MISWILLLMWVLIIPIVFILKKIDISGNVYLLLSQIYNFIIGFSSLVIFFFVDVFFLKFFGDFQKSEILGLCFRIIFLTIYFIILILPNIKMKKNIEYSIIKYIVLSIFSVILGVVAFMLFGN